MLIREILERKKYLDFKLKDIDKYIGALNNLEIEDKGSLYNQAIEIKFNLLSKIRSHSILLQDQNKLNTVVIGDNEITVYEAVKLRTTLKDKIKTLDFIISKGDFKVVSVVSLMEQRDSLFDEFIVLDMAITSSDSTTEWVKNN